MSNDGVVELESVVKHYNDRQVLNSISLTVYPGEMVALTGPSGSGKTTILNLLGLVDSPDSGSVALFGGIAPKPRSRAATLLRRRRLGYLFQNFALIDNATVRQNLAVALAYGRSASSATCSVESALETVGLPGVEDRFAYTLSGGEQQRVAIARLLLKPCDLIVADEPTGSLDNANAEHVVDLLTQISQGGKAVLIATHDPRVAERCSRVIKL